MRNYANEDGKALDHFVWEFDENYLSSYKNLSDLTADFGILANL